MYMYTENYGKKGPNEVITALNDYITSNKKESHTTLYLFCVNSFSQNKNKTVFKFLDQLCVRKVFEYVQIFYLIPGHSMMPIDRCFASIKKQRLKTEKMYSPQYYVDLAKSCRARNPFQVVFFTKSDNNIDSEKVITILDYKAIYAEKIKSINGISKCRSAKFAQ